MTIAGRPDDQILADGLMETLASSLTTLEQFERGLRVVPASEVRRERIESARQARQSFGATLAISGSLQREGDALRLTFNLIDSVQLVQLASRTIDLPAGENHRGLQQMVAATVASLLDLQLQPEASQAMTAGGSAEPGAYQQFARGRGYLQRFDRGADHVDLAIDAFAQAIKSDPKFALAYAAAAESYWRKYESSRLPVWLDRAEEHAEHALAINPRLPAIHVVLAMIARGRGRYEEAAVMAQRAVSLDPVAADGYRELGRAYEAIDRGVDAEATYRRAIAARPDDWLAYNTLGSFLLARRRWAEAETAFKQAIALTPDNTRAHNNLGATYYSMGRPDDAAAAWEHSSAIRPTSAAASNLGHLLLPARPLQPRPRATTSAQSRSRRAAIGCGEISAPRCIGRRASATRRRPRIGGRSSLRSRSGRSIRGSRRCLRSSLTRIQWSAAVRRRAMRQRPSSASARRMRTRSSTSPAPTNRSAIARRRSSGCRKRWRRDIRVSWWRSRRAWARCVTRRDSPRAGH